MVSTVVVAAMMSLNSVNVQVFPCPFPLFEEFVACGHRSPQISSSTYFELALQFCAKMNHAALNETR
jgi:hypothetical protein